MVEPVASIEIGTHTARLLIVRPDPQSTPWQTLLRRRIYIRLAEGLDAPEGAVGTAASGRTLEALRRFSRDLRRHRTHRVYAVATGLFREASNAQALLDEAFQETGIRIRRVTGREEARLSARGALSAVPSATPPMGVFDLGGGSTEFFLCGCGGERILSLPLGAAIFTRRFLGSDPPAPGQIRALRLEADRLLKGVPLLGSKGGAGFLIGTGGTVTTLAAMLHGRLGQGDLEAESINGLVLRQEDLLAQLERLCALGVSERARASGLEPGRASVIVAGIEIVLRVLARFGLDRITASMWDLLEGQLLENWEAR